MNNARTLPQHAPGWKYNLPAPNDSPALCKTSKLIRKPPTHICQDYLELPRSTLQIRGLNSLLMSLAFLISTSLLALTIYWISAPALRLEFGVALISLSVCGLIYWTSIPLIRIDLELPRNEPIRFNRLRRKVYFYQYRYDRIRIFSRSRWGVKPVAYDWDDLIAEASSVYAPMGNGGLIENVTIAVRKPGTDEIIDRLFFTHDIELGKQYWAIAQLFMQQGPEALPKFVHPPRDWNNDAEISFIRRLAPKVKWPEAIDLESRTAPAAGEKS